jgi:hypothetical protein
MPDNNSHLDLVESWEYARKQYDTLVARDGEARLLAEIHDARSQSAAYISQQYPNASPADYFQLRWDICNHLSQIFSDAVHFQPGGPGPANIQVVYNLSDQSPDHAYHWHSLAEGSNGALLAWRNSDGFDPPDIVRFDPATKQLSVVKSLDKSWYPDRVNSRVPGSIQEQDGLIYGSLWPSLIQLHEDGSGAQCRDVFKPNTVHTAHYHVLKWDGPSVYLLGDNFLGRGIYRDDASGVHLVATYKSLGMSEVADETFDCQGNDAYIMGISATPGQGAALCKVDLRTGQGGPVASFPGATVDKFNGVSNLLRGRNNGYYVVLSVPNTGLVLYWVKTDGSEKRPLRTFTMRPDIILIGSVRMTQGSDGWIYWLTSPNYTNGTILCRISPDGSKFERMYKFGTVPSLGSDCEPILVPHSDGCLYGIASRGGRDDKGTLFKILPDPNQASFDPPPNGVPALDQTSSNQSVPADHLPPATAFPPGQPSAVISSAPAQASTPSAPANIYPSAQTVAAESGPSPVAPAPDAGTHRNFSATAFEPDNILRSCLVRTIIGTAVSPARFRSYHGKTMEFTASVARFNDRERLVVFQGGGVFPLNWDLQLHPASAKLKAGQTYHVTFLLTDLVMRPITGYSFRGNLVDVEGE